MWRTRLFAVLLILAGASILYPIETHAVRIDMDTGRAVDAATHQAVALPAVQTVAAGLIFLVLHVFLIAAGIWILVRSLRAPGTI